MRLHEYQAKELFRLVGIPVAEGHVAATADEATAAAQKLGGPVVVKAQVLVGGRGKAGGIQIARTAAEAGQQAEKILTMDIKGERVRQVLITRAVDIAGELYLSLVVDRVAQQPVAIFSTQGGMEIEELARVNPEALQRFAIHPLLGLQAYQVNRALYGAGVEAKLMQPLRELFARAYQAFTRFRATLLEINPLAVVGPDRLIALDAKLIVDDDDLAPEVAVWSENEAGTAEEKAARRADLQYVKLDGNIGVIGNGAGLVMATLDLVALQGGKPANFLDIGGGASAEQMAQALEIVMSDPQVKGLYINIFGGITRCDEVARGLVAVRSPRGFRLPMVVRLTGTNEEQGRRVLQDNGILPVSSMEEGAGEIVRRVA